MSEAWDDRRKVLEEEYFRRQEKEALEKLRAKTAAESAKQESEAAALKCPRCGATLEETTHEGVTIDRCGNCKGVWLDAGELERLTQREESGWLGRILKGTGGEK